MSTPTLSQCDFATSTDSAQKLTAAAPAAASLHCGANLPPDAVTASPSSTKTTAAAHPRSGSNTPFIKRKCLPKDHLADEQNSPFLIASSNLRAAASMDMGASPKHLNER